MSISQMRKLRPRGNVTHWKYHMHCLCGGRVVGARAFGTLAMSVSPPCPCLPQREPAAPREQLYQRVQHSRQLHVQQQGRCIPGAWQCGRAARLLEPKVMTKECREWACPLLGGAGGGPSRVRCQWGAPQPVCCQS